MTTGDGVVTTVSAGLGFLAVDIPDAGIIDNIGGMGITGLVVYWLLQKFSKAQDKQTVAITDLKSSTERNTEATDRMVHAVERMVDKKCE